MCKKTVTTTRWAARKRRRAWRRRRRSAAGVRSAGYRAKCDRGGAAGFWAMSGAATKLPPKKLLQRHAGPSQRAAGQLLWRCAPCGLRKRAKTQLDLRRLRRDSSRESITLQESSCHKTQPNKPLTSPSIYSYCSLAVLRETRVVLRFAATTTSSGHCSCTQQNNAQPPPPHFCRTYNIVRTSGLTIAYRR